MLADRGATPTQKDGPGLPFSAGMSILSPESSDRPRPWRAHAIGARSGRGSQRTSGGRTPCGSRIFDSGGRAAGALRCGAASGDRGCRDDADHLWLGPTRAVGVCPRRTGDAAVLGGRGLSGLPRLPGPDLGGDHGGAGSSGSGLRWTGGAASRRRLAACRAVDVSEPRWRAGQSFGGNLHRRRRGECRRITTAGITGGEDLGGLDAVAPTKDR